MHIVSDDFLKRDGYIYNEYGIGYPENARPEVVWNHIDGPLLYSRDGRLHWLTLLERLRFWLRLETVETLEHKRWPHIPQ